jgi:hypothetical protein
MMKGDLIQQIPSWREKKGRSPSQQVLKREASVKYLVPSSTQFALSLAKQSFAHLSSRLHEFLAFRTDLAA